MTNQKLMDALQQSEIKYGLPIVFDTLWHMCRDGDTSADTETVKEVMQRWHFLYGEEYEALCREYGIDFSIYEVEDTTM